MVIAGVIIINYKIPGFFAVHLSGTIGEEAIRTDKGDRFIIRYAKSNYNKFYNVVIEDSEKVPLTYMNYVNSFPASEKVRLMADTPDTRCYYLYDCLVYRTDGRWKGLRLDDLADEDQDDNKNLPEDIKVLARKILSAHEETLTAGANDKFIVEYAQVPNNPLTEDKIRIRIKDIKNRQTIVSRTFPESSLEKERFKLVIKRPHLKCYYIYGCLVYRREGNWQGIRLDYLQNHAWRYLGKGIPKEVTLLAQKEWSLNNDYTYHINPDRPQLIFRDEFLVRYSRTPFAGTTRLTICESETNRPIISITASENDPEIYIVPLDEYKDFRSLFYTPALRVYAVYDCLIYFYNNKWQGVHLESLLENRLYYAPLNIPEALKNAVHRLLSTEEEIKATGLGDRFTVEYSQIPNDWRVYSSTFVDIKDYKSGHSIITRTFDEKCLPKEDFITVIDNPDMRCYYIYGCLVYLHNGVWEGIRLDYMTDREQHYHGKKIPEEIIKLADAYQTSKEKYEIYTEATGEPFIIEYSKNPFSGQSRVKISKLNNPIMDVQAPNYQPSSGVLLTKDDFRLLENHLDFRCYLVNDCLLYRGDRKWNGIPLDLFTHPQLYYAPQMLPYEIKLKARQLLNKQVAD
jgi:hypothetical protein